MIDARAGTAADYLPFFDFAVKKEKQVKKEEKNACIARRAVVPYTRVPLRAGHQFRSARSAQKATVSCTYF
jgi:hypothetical protein